MKGLKKWLAGLDKAVAASLAVLAVAATAVGALTGVLGQVVDAVECVEVAVNGSTSEAKLCDSSSSNPRQLPKSE